MKSIPFAIVCLVFSFLAGAEPAFQEPVSRELEELYRADQRDRQGLAPDAGPEAWKAVSERDRARRERVLAIVASQTLETGADYYHAAMVLQHGNETDHYLLAHLLATAAAFKGDERGRWLSAAALDRYLQNAGESQVFGTQFRRSGDEPFTMEPFSELLTDAVRRDFGVPSLEESRQRLERMNP